MAIQTTKQSVSPVEVSRRIRAPFLILAIALLLTVIATLFVARTTRTEDYLRFDGFTRQTDEGISARVNTYVSLLSGASGLFAVNDHVDRVSFRAYVSRLGAPMHDPGIRGIGFTQRVLPGTEAAVIASMHTQGHPDFHFWPATPPGVERFASLFNEPEVAGNQAGTGYNMFTEPNRRAAMEQARDTGLAASSARIIPITQIKKHVQKSAFVIFLPVYAGGAVPPTVAERRQKLIGFVFSGFWADDLVESTLEDPANRRIDFTVYDGAILDDTHLLARVVSPKPEGHVLAPPQLVIRQQIPIAGRNWTIIHTPGASFETGGAALTPAVFLVGLIVSVVLFTISLAQARARSTAEENASRLRVSDAARRSSEARARQLVESNIIGVLRANFEGIVLEANDALLNLSGYTRADMEAGMVTMASLTPPEMAKRNERALRALRRHGPQPPIESALLRRDGERIPILLGATPLTEAEETAQADAEADDKAEFIAFLLDIRERKEAERTLRDQEIRQRAFFRDVLASVTEGKLRLCDTNADLPPRRDPIVAPIALTAPTLRKVRQSTRDAAQMSAMSEERVSEMLTAVGEASMNAVVHAGGGTAYVGYQDGVVQVWIEDHGAGIDMQSLPQATLERGFTTAGSLGHGFWLMLKTIDRLWLLTGPQGTTVVMEQDAIAQEPSWLVARTGGG